MIYFDNAASSWPKPEGVAQAMFDNVHSFAANPGRGGHRLSVQAGQVVEETRKKIARLFHVQDARNVLFFPNATGALNQAIHGFSWSAEDEVICTTYEHNSVRRPLEYLRQQKGITIHYIQPDHNGRMDLHMVQSKINVHTKLMLAAHVSNLTGAILPIADLGSLCVDHEIPFLVDASQSAGILPIDVQQMNIDLLAFPGHKGLYGPQGTGVLYMSPDLDLAPLWQGGTGSQSEAAQQPAERPARYEAGTVNTPGIAGLNAGVEFVQKTGLSDIWAHEQQLTRYARTKLAQTKGVHIYGPDASHDQAPVIAFNLDQLHPQEVATILDQHYDIAVRAGLHCTPLAHRSVETGPEGSLRISFGYFNVLEEVDRFIAALEEIRLGLLGT